MASLTYRTSGAAGFTLIELLVVVMIIAILAAIAVPNFLEAQTRSKVARVAADMRSIRTALESYRVDSNMYPETDWGMNIDQRGAGMIRLTSPISYLTSIPPSPFREANLVLWPSMSVERHAKRNGTYFYARSRYCGTTAVGEIENDQNGDGLDDFYEVDRCLYLANQIFTRAPVSQGEWGLKSVGPDSLDERSSIGLDTCRYDPTNGTVSAGDIVLYDDMTIPVPRPST